MTEEIELQNRDSGSQRSSEEEEEEEDEEEEIKNYASFATANNDRGQQEEKPLWNRFRALPKEQESISMADTTLIDLTITALKIAAYLLTFCGVLVGGVLSKSILLLMTSQLTPGKKVTVAQGDLYLELELPDEEKYLWVCALVVSFAGPELGSFIRSLRHIWFKGHIRQEIQHDGRSHAYVVTTAMETLHVLGMALFVFEVLPQIDAVRGAMLTNCVCLTPAVLGALSYAKERFNWLKWFAVLFQLSGYVLWPLLDWQESWRRVFIPLSLFLISCGWWMNFVSEDSPIGFVRFLGRAKNKLRENDIILYKLYVWLSLWKVLVFGIATCGILSRQGVDLLHFFKSLDSAFNPKRTMSAFELEQVSEGAFLFFRGSKEYSVKTIGINVLWIVGVQMLSSYFCYGFSKFSYKTMISSFGFAFPVIFVVPCTITLIIVATGFRNEDPNVLNDILYEYIFFNVPSIYSVFDLFVDKCGWVWFLWLISQTLTTLHVWSPKCERLSRTEKIFATPMYSDYLVDQSILHNRKRDKLESGAKPLNTFLPHIIACATMWHESRPEMLEMLKSVMRMDQDHFFRKAAKENLNPDEETNCYTYETHIFFDSAFEIEDESTGNMVINGFVKDLMASVNIAAQAVYERNDIYVPPPKKTGTPYGGRLTYTLPCKSMLYVHLKNKDKIRHRKRWSQVMYMYYLLGYNLMEKEQLSDQEKLKKAENTFLLALDGDIDFKPQAVLLLVDLMKKNSNLGAACGRIHPVGSGFMVWYQKFEYAIGHWLQKATEHMIGCVLCSPGCFSLFRGSALMAENVMKTYTTKAEEARHYVQYDQGEDRWLCTLLLQRGYRVEYSAASDAYTHCPESFNEFYTQRRRWVPSTMANILDLLYDYKKTVKINNDISLLYIMYQLMLVIGTVLGPGTIFLLLVSAFNAAFGISNWTCFLYNMIPILFYVCICLTMTNKIQLIAALILSGVYALIMMAVLVGMLMQISEDGLLAPSTIFLYIVAGEILIAGLIHPQEFLCLIKGPIYYVTIPSMYLLLIIYSVCNLNVVEWGTREVKEKKTKAELEEEMKEAKEKEKEKQKGGTLQSIFGNLGTKKTEEDEGAVEFSLGNIFKFMLCTRPKSDAQAKHISKINESLEGIGKRIENIEKNLENDNSIGRLRKSPSRETINSEILEGMEENTESNMQTKKEEEKKKEDEEARDDLINPYWIEDEALKSSDLVVMDMNEVNFWTDLIAEYLHPLVEDKKKKETTSQALKELRNKMVMTFFMLNALFVIVVFLLQMNKEKVHLKWPLDAKVNMTVTDNEVRVTKTHLQLEPVGVVFIIFFSAILVIQFLAMLFHRFETLCHLLSSATILLPWKRKEKTFDMKVKDGKQQFFETRRRSEETRMNVTILEEPISRPVDVEKMTDQIFSHMKHKQDLEMEEKERRKKSSVFRKLSEITTQNTRFRYSQFRNQGRLEQVTEEA